MTWLGFSWRAGERTEADLRALLAGLRAFAANELGMAVSGDPDVNVWHRPPSMRQTYRPSAPIGPDAAPQVPTFLCTRTDARPSARPDVPLFHSENSLGIVADVAIWFVVQPTPGCLPVFVGGARWPETVPCPTSWEPSGEADVPWADEGWFGVGGCDTSEASAPRHGGVVNYLRAHLSLVALYDECRRLEPGVEVNDATGFDEMRDPAQLIERLQAHLLGQAKRDGELMDQPRTVVVGALPKRRDFEHLEMGRPMPVPADWRSQVEDLLRRTRAR